MGCSIRLPLSPLSNANYRPHPACVQGLLCGIRRFGTITAWFCPVSDRQVAADRPSRLLRGASLRAFIQFLAHVLEELRLRFGRILADLARLRHSKRGHTMRREIAFVVHPGDQLTTLCVLVVA